MEIDIECDCGNPNCHNTLNLRRGLVYKAGSSKPSHNMQLYAMVMGFDGCINSETFIDPYKAKQLMWFMISQYMPIVRNLVNLYNTIAYRIECWQYERKNK